MPDFTKTVNDIRQLKTYSFEALNFNLILNSYCSVLYEGEFSLPQLNITETYLLQ